MAKNCVITLDPDVVDRASENASKHGKSLKEVIEGTIVDLAQSKTEGAWITEKALEAEPWAPSRVSLFQMRKDGKLKEGVHYKRRGRFIYYNRKALKNVFAPARKGKAPKVGKSA